MITNKDIEAIELRKEKRRHWDESDDDIDTLIREIKLLKQRITQWEDRDDEWKIASGLQGAHGDPSNVTPKDLEKLISRLDHDIRNLKSELNRNE